MTIRELIENLQKVNNQDAPVTVTLSYKDYSTALKIDGLTDWGRFVCIDTETEEAECFIDTMKTVPDESSETEVHELILVDGEIKDCPNTGTACWFSPNPTKLGKGTIARRWTDGETIYVTVPEWNPSILYPLNKIYWEC